MRHEGKYTTLAMRRIVAVISTVVLALFAGLTVVQAGDELKHRGLIETRPEGTVGEWVVGGRSFTANEATELDEEEGPLAVGTCAKVKFTEIEDEHIALEIDSEPAHDCSPNDDDDKDDDCPVAAHDGPGDDCDDDDDDCPSAATEGGDDCTPDDHCPHAAHDGPGDDCDDDHELLHHKGLIKSRPQEGKVGEWVVGGRSFTANEATEIDEEEGPLSVGACAKVTFKEIGDDHIAIEIDSEPMGDCTPGDDDDDDCPTAAHDGPRDDCDDDNDLETYGRITALPDESLIGTWVISGVNYVTTDATEFETEFGAFAVGVCVKVHYFPGEPYVAREIETERSFKCGPGQDGDDDDDDNERDGLARGELYGIVRTMPEDGLTGSWDIGGLTFVATEETEFNSRRGDFAVGVTVKVHFFVAENGDLVMREIEVKFARGDDDDDGDGHHEGAEGHAFGVVSEFPENLVGNWIIGGELYIATTDTRFKQVDGEFQIEGRVKVLFYINREGQRIARKIETTNDNGGVREEGNVKLVGFVEAMPEVGFVGEWKVGSTVLDGPENAEYKELHGLLSLGAYVEVEYRIVEGVNVIREIKTQVPPGAGSENRAGVIESIGDGLAAAATRESVWRVGGVDYVITAATQINDVQADLTVGSIAVVNSYTTNNGTKVATRVTARAMEVQQYLPIAER